jgi:hypothetical protein
MSRTRQKNNPRVDEPRNIRQRAKYLRRDDSSPMAWQSMRDADNNADMMALNKTIDRRALPEVKKS